MRMRRPVAAIIAVSLILTALPACGKDRAEDGVINLRFVTYDNGSVPLDAKEVIAAANRVSAEKIGVTVDLEFQSKEKINLMMASGEYYDMVFTSSWLNRFDQNAPAGLFLDITDMVEEMPGLYDPIGQYWDCAKSDGRIYAVPILKDMGAENMFRLNSDYFEGEKGMKIPDHMNFEDIEPYFAAYKKDNPEKYPFAMDKAGVPGFYNFLERVVDPVVVIPFDRTDAPKAVPFYECEELTDRFRLLHKWYEEGYIEPDAATLDTSMTDKSIPVRVGVAWRGYQGYSNPADWGFDVKTSIYDGPYLSRSSEQGAMIAICAGCDEQHARAALRYIELLSTDRKFRDILGYGIEGKHFEYLDNGTVLRLQAGIDRYNTKLYQTGSVVNASVESVSRTMPGDPDQWTKVYEGYREYGIYSNTGGFAYDPTPKEDIITALTAIYNDYSSELLTGTSDPDKVLPEIRRRMEAAGIQELIEDIQSKLDDHIRKMEK